MSSEQLYFLSYFALGLLIAITYRVVTKRRMSISDSIGIVTMWPFLGLMHLTQWMDRTKI